MDQMKRNIFLVCVANKNNRYMLQLPSPPMLGKRLRSKIIPFVCEILDKVSVGVFPTLYYIDRVVVPGVDCHFSEGRETMAKCASPPLFREMHDGLSQVAITYIKIL